MLTFDDSGYEMMMVVVLMMLMMMLMMIVIMITTWLPVVGEILVMMVKNDFDVGVALF